MKSILLSTGKRTVVDNEDFLKFSKFSWTAANGYPARYIYIDGKKTCVYLHREIVRCVKEKVVDHINGNKLDNRKSNLRVCSQSENLMNKGLIRTNTVGYKGVYWHKKGKKWMSAIGHLGKQVYIGLFPSKTTAARAYNKKAIELFGEFARLNPV